MKINCSICNIELNVKIENSLPIICSECFKKSHDVDLVDDDPDPLIWTEWTQKEIDFARKIDENKFDR